ncbi:MAG TPA: DUF1761 domain-containing protein [Pyrinomonadaceae bacterium]
MRINYLAVIVAAVVHFIIGGLWYGLVFGNQFIQLIGWSQEKLAQVANQNHGQEYLIAFVSSLVLVFILAHFVQYTKAKTAVDGLQTAFWLWLGFIVTTQLSTVVFEERRLGLYLLNIGYQFVGTAVAGIILALWKPKEARTIATQPVV